MSLQPMAAFVTLYVASLALFAVLYVRPRALASPGTGYDKWSSLLAASLLALAPAGYAFLKGSAVQWSTTVALVIVALAICLIGISLYYLRPQHAAHPSRRSLRRWWLFLICGISLMTLGILLPFTASL